MTYTRRKADSACFNGEDYEVVVARNPCQCSEMDYECDFGFARKDGSSTCDKITGKDGDTSRSDRILEKRQEEQCKEGDFYE